MGATRLAKWGEARPGADVAVSNGADAADALAAGYRPWAWLREPGDALGASAEVGLLVRADGPDASAWSALLLAAVAIASGRRWAPVGWGPRATAAACAVGAAGAGLAGVEDAVWAAFWADVAQLSARRAPGLVPWPTGRPLSAGPFRQPAYRAALRKAGTLPFAPWRSGEPLPSDDGIDLRGVDLATLSAGDRSRLTSATGPLLLDTPDLAPDLLAARGGLWAVAGSGPDVLRAATSGAAAVLLTGNEGATPAGPLGSLALWEAALAAAPSGTVLVFAGGLVNESAARLACAMAATAPDGVSVALHAETAFVATHEAVELDELPSLASAMVLGARSTRRSGRHHVLPPPPDGRDMDPVVAGPGAGLIRAVRSVRAVADDLAPVGTPRRAPRSVASKLGDGRVDETPRDAIAVVGIGARLPGGRDAPSWWIHRMEGRDAIGPLPDGRWDAARYHDPAAGGTGPARSYVRLAGTVGDLGFDPVAFRIPPRTAPALDPSQRLALMIAAEAVDDAGWPAGRGPDRQRAAVLFGNAMGGEYAKDLAVRVRFREVVHALVASGHLPEVAREEAERDAERWLDGHLPPVEAESMAGLLANVVAGRVASWRDWMGGNWVVDAACAASLAAIASAVDQLRTGRIDVALAGGVDTDLSAETFVGFCRTAALSPVGSRPFSRDADGFVMGEGGAAFALMRLQDAIDADRPIWAVIRGVGTSSDGRGVGITAPSADGQRLAISRAWRDAGLPLDGLGYVAAHGTGTALGDRTELAVLAELFRASPPWVGSAKSSIGHLKGAAGAAGLLEAVWVAATGLVPPSLHAGPVRDDVGDRLSIPCAPTVLASDRRLVGVSAFGFGGTNWHLVIEPPPAHARRPERLARAARSVRALALPPARSRWSDRAAPRLTCFAGNDVDELRQAVVNGQVATPRQAASAPHRLVVLGPDAASRALRALDGVRTPSTWLGTGPPRRLALLAPGQGAQRAGGWDLLERIPSCARALAATAEGEPDGDDPKAVHEHLVGAAIGWAPLLAGLPIEGAVGHSLGELSALVLARRLAPDDALRLARARGAALDALPAGAMVALTASPEAAQALGATYGLVLAVINGPRACVLAGPEAAVQALAAEREDARILRAARAYHHPTAAPAVAPFRDALATVDFAVGLPTWSPATGAKHRDDPRRDLAAAIVCPVDLPAAVAALREEIPGALLLEVGPGATLARHVDGDVVSLDPEPGDGGRGFAAAAAALVAAGHATWLEGVPATVVAIAPAGGPVSRSIRGPWVPSVEVQRPMSAPMASRDDVEKAVLDAIVAVTGYPVDAIEEGGDLASDLGIDSIRRMEILGQLRTTLAIPVREADYATLARTDLNGLVSWVRARRAEGPQANAERSDGGLWRLETRPTPILGDPAAAALEAVTRLRDGQPQPTDPVGAAASAAAQRCLKREAGAPPFPAAWRPVATPPTSPGIGLVIATGSVDGILGPCLRALGDRPMWVLSRNAPRESGPWQHASVDVTDPHAVDAAVRAARRRWGPVTTVIHAAGALADGPLASTSEADLRRVIDVKVRGAAHLWQATAEDAPDVAVDFSSLVAHLGNAGQPTYAAANAAMEAVRHPTAKRHVHLAWTAWSDRGMAADAGVAALLAARGLVPLSPTAGARLFLGALGLDGLIAVAAQPPPGAQPWRPPLGAPCGPHAVAVAADPGAPWLADHRVAGRPLVPAATWLAAFAELAPEVDAWVDFEVVAPTFVDTTRTDLRVVRTVDGAEALAGVTVVARARAGQRPTAPAPLPPPCKGAPTPYGDPLFHGPHWQVLRDDDGESASVDVGDLGLAGWVDAIHQLAVLRQRQEGRALALPTGARCWVAPNDVPKRGHIGVRNQTWVCCDTQGAPFAWVTGLQLTDVAP